MTDPAVYAAHRARRKQMIGFPTDDAYAEAAAREALAPLRELHVKTPTYLDCDNRYPEDVHPDGFESSDGEWCCPACTENNGGPLYVCSECRDEDGYNKEWPCDTAKLIYPSEDE